MQPATIVLIALAVLFVSPLGRILIGALFGRSIGRAALAKQPDTIHLLRCDPASLRNAAKVQAFVSEYRARGFEDAGVYSIPEMNGTQVQLLAHPGESMYGAIYDHPVAGVWCDVVSRYVDSSVWTYSTSRPTGLKPLPNVHSTNLPGSSATGLIERARTSRPGVGLCRTSTSSAVTDFEQAYAEHVAALKQRGISTGEVVKVAGRKAA